MFESDYAHLLYSVSQTSLDDPDTAVAVGNSRLARAAYVYPANKDLDDIICRSLGVRNQAEISKDVENWIGLPEIYRFEPVLGTERVRVTHRKVRRPEPAPAPEQSLKQPETAKILLENMPFHPTSIVLCRRWLRDSFGDFVVDDSSPPLSLSLDEEPDAGFLEIKWKEFRTRFLNEAQRIGGKFNMVNYVAHFFFRTSQLAPSETFPADQRAQEETIQLPNWKTKVTINVHNLRGARLLSEGGRNRPHRSPIPDKIADTVFLSRKTLLLVPLPLDAPLKPTSSILQLPFDAAQVKIDEDRKNEIVQLASWTGTARRNLLGPIVRGCLIFPDPPRNTPPNDVDRFVPCFFCSKPTPHYIGGRWAIISDYEVMKSPLAVVHDEYSLFCCAEPAHCGRQGARILTSMYELMTNSNDNEYAAKIRSCNNPNCPWHAEASMNWQPGQEKKKMQRCSRCKGAWYCSQECQKIHWKVHKTFCLADKD